MSDREKLIELFNECEQIRATSDRDKLVELMKPVLNNKYLDKSNWIDFMAEWLVANGVTVQKWIPVTERLPEAGKTVLVYGNRGGTYTAYLEHGGEYPLWHKLNSKSHYCNPTHWMPLPEPPKEE